MSYGWTRDQEEFLRKHYARKGAQWCSERVGKAKVLTQKKAQNMGLRFAEIPGWVRASVIAEAAGASRIVGDTRARANSAATRRLVKASWADSFINSYISRGENEGAGYIDVQDASRILGVGKSSISRALTGSGYLAGVFKGVRWLRGHHRKLLFNPFDVEDVRKRIASDRTKARGMFTVKALSVDAGVPENTVREWLARKGVEKHWAVTHGRVRMFVSAVDAASFLEAFGVQLERAA